MIERHRNFVFVVALFVFSLFVSPVRAGIEIVNLCDPPAPMDWSVSAHTGIDTIIKAQHKYLLNVNTVVRLKAKEQARIRKRVMEKLKITDQEYERRNTRFEPSD